ncbi:hypothetical protein [Cellulomonas sp. NPDC089187]|uniref:hypothetical protein n=1 Tax=Cellulomonas sp. NPDC089187 TaxID=3154970 RepID=UPI00343F03E3
MKGSEGEGGRSLTGGAAGCGGQVASVRVFSGELFSANNAEFAEKIGIPTPDTRA